MFNIFFLALIREELQLSLKRDYFSLLECKSCLYQKVKSKTNNNQIYITVDEKSFFKRGQ